VLSEDFHDNVHPSSGTWLNPLHAALQALPPMQPEMPHNRLGLAHWILLRENPLTARVTVNRIWSQLFGVGIVETTEDFGVKGSRPSNQDLLDWLAVEFIGSGWNLRHMVKTMVMSATYRQSEAVSPQKLERDPANKLFARGPHVRLDAEEIRDQALAASGLLVAKVGGPPVKPYQPEGVWEAVAMKVSNTSVYQQDHGEALYRRSLYTFWKRIAPPPTLEILNAPSREVFCTRRDRTDTPLQAFVTLNDPQFVEAAKHFGARILREGCDEDARLDFGFRTVTARYPSKTEKAALKNALAKFNAKYQKNPQAAEKLIAVGERPLNKDLKPSEAAAYTMFASLLLIPLLYTDRLPFAQLQLPTFLPPQPRPELPKPEPALHRHAIPRVWNPFVSPTTIPPLNRQLPELV